MYINSIQYLIQNRNLPLISFYCFPLIYKKCMERQEFSLYNDFILFFASNLL